jgi:hypothetical protein
MVQLTAGQTALMAGPGAPWRLHGLRVCPESNTSRRLAYGQVVEIEAVTDGVSRAIGGPLTIGPPDGSTGDVPLVGDTRLPPAAFLRLARPIACRLVVDVTYHRQEAN